MACKYQTRGYNQVFVDVLKSVQSSSTPGRTVIEVLQGKPHGYDWPTTVEMEAAFSQGRYYGPGGINQERLRLLLGSIDKDLQKRATKSEAFIANYSELQIEHVIPQAWRMHWPVIGTGDGAELQVAETARENHINRIGNLTLLTGPLNQTMSNDPWGSKRSALSEHSKLEINAQLVTFDEWNEEEISHRGVRLAQQLANVWPGPESNFWVS